MSDKQDFLTGLSDEALEPAPSPFFAPCGPCVCSTCVCNQLCFVDEEALDPATPQQALTDGDRPWQQSPVSDEALDPAPAGREALTACLCGGNCYQVCTFEKEDSERPAV